MIRCKITKSVKGGGSDTDGTLQEDGVTKPAFHLSIDLDKCGSGEEVDQ